MSTITHDHVACEGNWAARSHAVFWEPGVEDWARRKLWLPEDAHVDAATLRGLKIEPHKVVDGPVPGNQLLNTGLAVMFNLLVLGTPAWAKTLSGVGSTGIAVGNGTTADNASQTDLSGSSKSYRVCDEAFPKRYLATHPVTGVTLTQGQLLFATTFASGEANFAWDEYGAMVILSGSQLSGAAVTSAPGNFGLLNRKSPAGLGSKSSGATASLYLLITVT